MSQHRKPIAPPALIDEPVAGPSVAITIAVVTPDEQITTAVSCALLGHGRDYVTRDDALVVAAQFNASDAPITCSVSEQFETVLDLVTAYPSANLDGTAKRMLAGERARDEYRQAVAAWEAEIAAAGFEPCGKCGGAGGWKGWPGFTCYDCGGSGVEEQRDESEAI